jgi:transcriptional regulator with XRE-family HTH domain
MNAKIFSRNLSIILELRDLKPIDLSRRSGVSRSYISQILAAKKENISAVSLTKIAIALDILPDDIIKLFDPDINARALIMKERTSIVVPFIFNFSKLTLEMIHVIQTMDFWKGKIPDINHFISFPKCEPFLIMGTHHYISCLIDTDVGMSPKIQTGDVLTINLDDTLPAEKRIYLVHTDHQLRFRYAKIQSVADKKYLRLWTEDRSLGEDMVDLDECETPCIIGNVRTGTRIF